MKIIKGLHNLNFRTKIVLSFLCVGVIPFIIMSTIFSFQKNDARIADQEYNLEMQYNNCVDTIITEIDKIERALDLFAYDQNISAILTSDFTSEYEKYYKVTTHLDSVVDTILATNESIEGLYFFVPNSLSEVRNNFVGIDSLKNDYMYTQFGNFYLNKWGFNGNSLCVYKKVFNLYNMNTYAVVKAVVKTDSLFKKPVFENINFAITFNDVNFYTSQDTLVDEFEVYKTINVFDNNGSFILYKPKYSLLSDNAGVISIIVAFIVALIIILLLIITISGSLVKRINYVNVKLQSIVESNFETTLEEDYTDEIGKLKQIVNIMIADTKKLIKDVYQGEIKQKDAEFKALQAQINPHFLHNALSAVNWRAIQTGNPEISSIVTMISKFYRTALNKGGRVTNIRNEVENIKAYVNIQLYVHSNSFDVEYEIDERILNFKMPNLIIQPIVENAIEHGINCLEEVKGYLKVNVFLNKENIVITVTNNGPKMKGSSEVLIKEGKGYGLYNVNKRLQLCFGDNYKLYFLSDDMTTTVIEIPVMK